MAPQAIIGRRDELDAIEGFVAEIASGSAALVLEGEAGSGKTTLLDAGVAAARGRGYHVLRTSPREAEARLALAGLADLLGEVAETLLADIPAIQRRALEGVLLIGPVAPDGEERVIGAATLTTLRRLAKDVPVLVAADDLQWLDASSAQALAFALPRLDAEAVRLLATVRAPPVGAEPPEVVRAPPRARMQPLSVGPLSVGALYELVRGRLGLSLSRPALLRLHELSGGNPFFALELARSLPSPEPVTFETLELPRSLADLVRARTADLTSDAATVLVAAAALGDPVLDAIERALPHADVIAALEEAQRRGIAEVAAGRVRFSHPLLANSIYSAASPRERRRIHRRLAGAVAHAEERARHLAIAADGPDERVALALEEAAHETEERGALTSAADLAAKAVELTPPESREALHRRRLIGARYAFAVGSTAAAQELLEAGLAAASPGSKRAEILHQLARIAFTQDIWLSLDLARRAADEAVDAPAQRAEILAGLAAVVGYRGDGYEAALPYAREAVELAERSGDPHILARSLTTLAEVESALGLGIDHAAFERAEALVGQAGRTRSTYRYCQVLVDAREHRHARERLERLAVLERERFDSGLCGTLSRLIFVECDEGNWERARQLAVEMEQVTEQVGWEAYLPAAQALRAFVETLLGDVETARRRGLAALEQTEARGRVSGAPLMALGLLELSVERYEEALVYLLESVARHRRHAIREPASVTSDAVEALAAVGRTDEAETLLAEFEETARRLDRRWALAAAARCRGLVAAARGDLHEAERELDESVRRWEEVAFPFELGRSLLALGSVRRRLRRKRAARDALGRALELFERLGAAVWAERARAETARIGGRAAPRDGLSGTEEAIAGLAAAGKSNREIAEALHLSPHTVEWNLSRIYRKLGVRSRTELAATRSVRE